MAEPASRSAGHVLDPFAPAVVFALAHPTPWPRDIRGHIEAGFFEPAPDNAILGPVAARGPANGLILWHG